MKISLNPKGLVCGLYLPMPVRFPAGAADGCHADNPHRGGWDHEVLLIDRWDMVGLLRDLTARGQHPGVIAFAEDGVASWDSKSVGDRAFRLACGLQDAGVSQGSRIAIWAPNSPVWIVSALAILAAGGVVVPIDDL